MSRSRSTAGFTLIELMIVISILGLLAVVLLPNIMGTQDAAAEADTKALFVRCERAAETFVQTHGYYPPADLRVREGKQPDWKPDNGQNTGIESFLAFVSWQRRGGTDFSDLGGKLANTDLDEHGEEMLLLSRSDRPELCDAWGTPLCYFTKFTMDKPQTVLGTDGLPQTVKARQDERGNYLGGRKFQFVSAGKDRTFGSEDDLTWPAN